MSGKKCTEVYLEQMAELLLQVKQEKNLALNANHNLFQRRNNLSSTITTIAAEDTNIAQRFKEYVGRLREEKSSIKQRQKGLNSIQLPATTRDVSTDRLKTIHQKILQTKKQDKKTSQLLDEINFHIINLKVADKSLADIEINLRGFRDELQAQEELLKKWLPEGCSDLVQRHGAITEEVTRHKDTLQKVEDTTRLATRLKETKDQIQGLNRKLADLIKESNHREELHQRRLYILKGLRDVCAALGFEEVEGPKYDKEGNYNSPVVQTFDTLNQGIVSFRLHLDNHIDSDSGISLDVCEEEFGRLSEMLAEEYGIKTEFKRIGQEELPKKITKTEKPMPQQGLQQRRHGM